MIKFKDNNFVNNISWNMVGFSVPVLSAIVLIPLLMKNIGIERFGVLTLIFAMIGFMNVFDFGLTRSITNCVIKYRENHVLMLASIKTGWLIIVIILTIVAILISLFNHDITRVVFNVSSPLIKYEVNQSLLVVAVSLPFVISQSTFVGVLEAFSCFRKISLGKIPFSVFMYLIPVIVSFFSSSLLYITISLCFLRMMMAVFFFIMMNNELKIITSKSLFKAKIQKNIAMELFKYGSWVSISNIIAPVMLYIDRFFVASIVGASLVAYYTTPYEVVSKMSIVAVSISGVLFPLLASKIKVDIRSANQYFKKSLTGIFCILLLPVIMGILFATPLLTIWINESFALHSRVIFSMFLIGFFIHGLVQPAFTWIQASGKPYITALAHLFDLSIYVIYFPFLTKQYGLTGAAASWVIRVSISLIILHTIRYILFRRGVK